MYFDKKRKYYRIVSFGKLREKIDFLGHQFISHCMTKPDNSRPTPSCRCLLDMTRPCHEYRYKSTYSVPMSVYR